MNVLHVYKDYYPVIGGIENHLKMVAEGQVKAGLKVTVLVNSLNIKTKIEKKNGVNIIKVGRLATFASSPIGPKIFSYIRKHKSDITHLHFPNPMGEVAHFLFGKGKKTVLTYHSDIVRQAKLLKFYNPLLLKILKKVDKIIATSPNYIDTSSYLKRFKDKCVQIPLGIDCSLFKPEISEIDRKLEKKYGKDYILFVGKLRYYKGLEYLIQAMKAIPAKLLIVGDGPLEETLKNLVKDINLIKKVLFLGKVEEDILPSLYRLSNFLVLPSIKRSEAFGIVQLEAMACGKPVICTELGTGTSYINQHERTGLIIPPGDFNALIQAISRLLNNKNEREIMGKRARNRVEEHFSFEYMLKKIIVLYENLFSC
ncbi:MAG: glycosyltransferase [Thermodesulfobacteriota bacterium]|nr:glycosyltransferase [Thermodesulfobacteriota bacterium]